MNKKETGKTVALIISILAILFYVVRASMRKGDFIGYINAGHLTLNGQDIYSDYLNTWPPFFSVFCVPLSLFDDVSSIAIRGVWLVLTLFAMFWMMKITVRWLHQLELVPPFYLVGKKQIAFTNILVFIPYVILFRFLLDNLANIQINIFLLWASVLVIDFFIKKKHTLAGLILAFIISLKVFPIFLLLYFIFKREFKIVGWTFLFLIIFNAIPMLIYGSEQGIAYYAHWWNEIASPFASVQHKNQSFFSMLRSLFRNESPGLDIYLNVMNMELDTLKKVAYGILIIGALYPMYLFRNTLKDRGNAFAILEYTFILTAIPILSPLAWKAYFIFLWPGYLLSYYYLYHDKSDFNLKAKKVLKILFIISIILNVISTDLFVGPYIADLLEVVSSITIGTLILMAILLVIYNEKRHLDTKSL